MATEITEAGYETIRDLVNGSRTAPGQWDYLALIDDTGSEVLRVSITGDSRASWSVEDQDASGNNETMLATISVTGGDSDITTPVTFTESRLYNTDTNGSSLSEDTFTDATLEASNDELTVEHRVEVPVVN